MPRVGLKRLIKAHEKEKAGKSKYRLHAARLRKEGKGIREISRILGVAYSTVRNWLVRMHAGNLYRRFDRRRRGRARMIPSPVSLCVIRPSFTECASIVQVQVKQNPIRDHTRQHLPAVTGQAQVRI